MAKKYIRTSMNSDIQSTKRAMLSVSMKCETAIDAVDNILATIDDSKRDGVDWSKFTEEYEQLEDVLDLLVRLDKKLTLIFGEDS